MPETQTLAEVLPSGLVRILRSLPGVAAAFSGGLDSRFLCHAARLCGLPVIAVHIAGPHVPARESRAAQSWAETRKIPFARGRLNPLDLEEAAANGKDRCYFCKKAVYEKVAGLAGQNGARAFALCDGSNLDDEGEYRPGRKAALEAGFISPLGMAGLAKKDIRRLAGLAGLDNPGQRARPCLLTRFAYGVRPSLESLAKLEKTEAEIEDALESLGASGADFRLRAAPAPILHITPVPARAREAVRRVLDNNGFENCDMVFMEKISGYYDRPKNP